MSKKINIIIEKSRELGIHKLGFTSKEDLFEEREKVEFLHQNGFFPENERWNKNNIKIFHSPSSFMDGTKSVIMAALCYKEEERVSPEKMTGKISMYTWRNNYKFLRKKLQKLGGFLKKYYGAKSKIFVNGPLAEKPLAKRSGLGNYGKNSIFYIDEYGSRIVLGGIVTDLDLRPNTYTTKDICDDCSLCIDACPTGAIIKPYILDCRKCFQYLGQHIYEEIPLKYRKLWGNRLYGCSICQDVCPLNESIQPVKDLSPYGVIGPAIELTQILKMNEEKFREKYKGNQISAKWVDFDAIRRNAIISMANLKEKKVIPLLKQLNSNSLKDYIDWSIQEINSRNY